MPTDFAQEIPRAINTPQGNRPGVVPLDGDKRTSQTLTTIIPAGGKLQVYGAGTQFYLILATAAVKIKPDTGSYNSYVQGTGEYMPQNPFRQLEVSNETANNVVISLFVGFGSYIDNRVILFNPVIRNVTVSTFGVPNAANSILIPDLSGQAITDLNGTSFLALSRDHIYISNRDSGVAYQLTNTAGTRSVLTTQPLTNSIYVGSGNYKISDGATLTLTVAEVYQAVLPTLT